MIPSPEIVVEGPPADDAASVTANLAGISLTGLTFEGSVADVSLDLPRPQGVVTIRIDGSARGLRFARPDGVPVEVRIDGGASRLRIDDEDFGAIGRGYRSGIPSEPDHYRLLIGGAVDGLTISC